MPDPKLKEAVAEIIGICRKHDIGGYFILASQTHAEFRYILDPSWSCAWLQEDGKLRIRAKRAEFKTQEEQVERLGQTTHILLQIQDLCAKGFMDMESIIKELSKQCKIEHESFAGFEPDRKN